MSNYLVEAKSRADLRHLACMFREVLHLDEELYLRMTFKRSMALKKEKLQAILKQFFAMVR